MADPSGYDVADRSAGERQPDWHPHERHGGCPGAAHRFTASHPRRLCELGRQVWGRARRDRGPVHAAPVPPSGHGRPVRGT